jgi:starch synthase
LNVKILYAASQALPLTRISDLAEVAGSLPKALLDYGLDVRVVMPAYRGTKERFAKLDTRCKLSIPGMSAPITVAVGQLRDNGPQFILVDAPSAFDRDGGLYADEHGQEYPDNAQRFAMFARVVVALGLGHGADGWRPDLVHCNDWQTGLVPALLAREWNRPATLFTIHNLAEQGIFDRTTFDKLDLTEDLWSAGRLEFRGNCSYIKGGIAFADALTTVSPTHADEICVPGLGYGFEGLLSRRKERLFGVLNGIDSALWDPANDPHVPSKYDVENLKGKTANKTALQRTFGLLENTETMLFGYMGALVEQKGVDLIIELLPWLLDEQQAQLLVLGNGNPDLEAALQDAAKLYPDQLGVFIGHDEPLSHLIEAGSDCCLMPSRFEPCGLNQMRSSRYGTVPIVRRTGGLADTVTDATTDALFNSTATGFVFEDAQVDGLKSAIERVLTFRHRPAVWWEKMQRAGMLLDFSWTKSASRYVQLYQFALDHPAGLPTTLPEVDA